jgi:hypothetical protein
LVPYDATSVLAATGESAALFRIGTDKKYALLGVPEQKQILAIARSGGEIYVATGNDAILYALGAGPAREGTYTSQPYDLRSVASWGKVVAGVTGGGEVTWSTRSGLSEEPDDGWSPWSSTVSMKEGVAAVESPAARFLQFRLGLKRGGATGPLVSSIEVAYLQRNLPPEIGMVQVFGPDNPYMRGPEYRPPSISQTFSAGSGGVQPASGRTQTGFGREHGVARASGRSHGRPRSHGMASLQRLHQGGGYGAWRRWSPTTPSDSMASIPSRTPTVPTASESRRQIHPTTRRGRLRTDR